MLKFCLAACLITGFPTAFAQNPSGKEVITQMLAATEKIQTLKFKLKKAERVDGKILTGEQDVKYQQSPRKTYAYLHHPSKGTEVLWIENANHGKVLVKPTTFPYISVSLSPFGSILRKNNHHTVHEVGFDYVAGIIRSISGKAGSNFDDYFLYQGEVLFNNRPCHKILVDYKPYAYITYTVQANENLPAIASKLYVSDYMIKQLNPEIDDYDDVETGQQIKVPNAYARKTVLYIDQEHHLPVVQRMYDENGLFSQYEFHNLQVNPAIADEEFTRNYKAYNF